MTKTISGFSVTVIVLAMVISHGCRSLSFAQEEVSDARGYAVVRFEKTPPGAAARLIRIDGMVFVQKNGQPLWSPAVEGQSLSNGDTVRTGESSSAELEYPQNGTVVIGAKGRAVIGGAIDKSSDSRIGILALESGKVWVNAETSDVNSKLILRAGESLMDTQDGKGFYEIAQDKTMCVDLFSGSMNLRLKNSPSQVVKIEPEKRFQVNLESNEIQPLEFDAAQDKDNSSYSCASIRIEPATEPFEDLPAIEIVSTGEDVIEETFVIIGSGMVNFDNPDSGVQPDSALTEDTSGNLVFGVEDSVKEADTSAETKAPEYVEMVITTSASLSFKKPEEPATAAQPVASATSTETVTAVEPTITEMPGTATSTETVTTTTPPITAAEPCTTQPVLSDITLNDKAVFAGSTEDAVLDTCTTFTANFSGKAEAACGTISSIKAMIGTTSLNVAGIKPWSTSAIMQTGKAHVQVYAVDTAGNKSEVFSFYIDVTIEQRAPSVSIQVIAGQAAPADGSKLVVNRDKLESGKMVLSGESSSEGCTVSKVEVSVDNGITWVPAAGTGLWSYSFSPSAGTYMMLARATDNRNKQSDDFTQPAEVEYSPYTEEELLRRVFESMIQAYKDKSSSGFMNSVSPAFSTNYDSIEDYSSLDNSLNLKFSSMSTISLRHRVDSVTVGGQEGRVRFYWDADPTTTTFSNYGTFIFMKETEWKMLSVSDDRTFLRYTTQAGTVSVTSATSTLIANETDGTTITVAAKDSAGQPIKDGSIVTFSSTLGSFSQQTASTVNGGAAVSFTAGATPGVTTITATVGDVSNSINLTIQPEHAPLPPN